MLRLVFCVAAFLIAASPAEAIQCYHCYDSFVKGPGNSLSCVNGSEYCDKFVRCDKNINKWNSWNCPEKWPVCVYMSGEVKDHYEIIRTCGEKGFCSKYVPPLGVTVDYCRECNTILCNDYEKKPEPEPEPEPEPPVDPSGPLFVFNININLNVKKYGVAESKGAE